MSGPPPLLEAEAVAGDAADAFALASFVARCLRQEARQRPTCEQLLATEALVSRARPMALLCPLRALAARHTTPPSGAATAATAAAGGADGDATGAAAPDGTACAGAAGAAAPLPLALARPAPLGQNTLGSCAGGAGVDGGGVGGGGLGCGGSSGLGAAAAGATLADSARRPSASNLDPDEIEEACGAWAAQRAALAVLEAEAGGLDRTVSLLAGRPMLVLTASYFTH